jgi:hypothetical protein
MADLADLLADERGLDRTVLPFPDLERTTELFDYPTEGVRRPRRRWQPLRLGAAAALSLLSVSPRQRAS